MNLLSLFPPPDLPGPYHARSASDHTDDWLLWYVAGPNGNTNYLTDLGKMGKGWRGCFVPKEVALAIAFAWNNPPRKESP